MEKDSSEFYLCNRNKDKLQHECHICNLARRAADRKKCKDAGILNYSQRTQRRLKLLLLQKYSGQNPYCACCNENKVEFLSIDHIDGGGRQHKIKLKKSGTSFYNWLRKNNFPKGFRVLCHNCNQSLGTLGYCPHKSPTPYCPEPQRRKFPLILPH